MLGRKYVGVDSAADWTGELILRAYRGIEVVLMLDFRNERISECKAEQVIRLIA